MAFICLGFLIWLRLNINTHKAIRRVYMQVFIWPVLHLARRRSSPAELEPRKVAFFFFFAQPSCVSAPRSSHADPIRMNEGAADFHADVIRLDMAFKWDLEKSDLINIHINIPNTRMSPNARNGIESSPACSNNQVN